MAAGEDTVFSDFFATKLQWFSQDFWTVNSKKCVDAAASMSWRICCNSKSKFVSMILYSLMKVFFSSFICCIWISFLSFNKPHWLFKYVSRITVGAFDSNTSHLSYRLSKRLSTSCWWPLGWKSFLRPRTSSVTQASCLFYHRWSCPSYEGTYIIHTYIKSMCSKINFVFFQKYYWTSHGYHIPEAFLHQVQAS